MPDRVLYTLSLIIVTTVQCKYYYSHITDEETEPQID